MDRSLKFRSIGLAIIVALCGLTLLPSLVGPENLPSWVRAIFDKRFNLGSDLRGGVQFVYSIDLNEAVRDKAAEIKRNLDEAFAESERTAGKVALTTPQTQIGVVNARFADAALKDEVVARFAAAEYSSAIVETPCTMAAEGMTQVCFRVSVEFAERTRKAALTHAVETIRERIDANGLAEPNVVAKGDDIIVELPGLAKEKVASVRETIARTAKLEFRIVDENGPFLLKLYQHLNIVDRAAGVPTEPTAAAAGIKGFFSERSDANSQTVNSVSFTAEDRKESVAVEQAREQELKCERDPATNAYIIKNGLVLCNITGRMVIERYVAGLAAADPSFAVPDDRTLGFELQSAAGKETWRTIYMESNVRLTGSSVSDAAASFDPQTNQPEVIVQFNRMGQRLFADTTGSNVGRLMAIVLDGRVRSAPQIQQRISTQASISVGSGTPDERMAEANGLVVVLKTGSLAAPLKEESFSEFGPTLGSDAVEKAKLSFGLGILLVIGIMVYYYRFSGWISIVVVFLNVFMMLSAMAAFGATLTLPGIAALVLTIGMAVDGNILIYERIRDELLEGKSVRGAVDAGFSRAFSAILDGQLTSAAAGFVLYSFGSGPIKGFAVMLLVGIATSLFTTTWVSRLFFDWYLAKKSNPAEISI